MHEIGYTEISMNKNKQPQIPDDSDIANSPSVQKTGPRDHAFEAQQIILAGMSKSYEWTHGMKNYSLQPKNVDNLDRNWQYRSE